MSGLTFKNGSFYFRTTQLSLREALKLRDHADFKAEIVFRRCLNEKYEFNLLDVFPIILDKHQYDGIKHILSRKRSYLAHAPGAGKTAQAIVAACLSKKGGQVLFLVPPSLTANWVREIDKFAKWSHTYKVSVVPLTNNQKKMNWDADFIICPDSMLTKPWVYDKLQSIPFKFIAVDEASRFKEPHTKRAQVFYGGKIDGKRFLGLYQNVRHCVFLDGSPMPNRPMELWGPTYALDPEAIDCMDMDSFGMHYCGPRLGYMGAWEFKGASNQDELHTKLTKRFMHVVTENELSHPERRRSMLFMTSDPRSREMKEWERSNLSKINLSELSENDSQGALAEYRHKLGLSKVQWSARYIADRLDTKNESIIVFAWHRDVCEALANHLAKYNPALIIGGVKNDERESYFQDFQSGKRRIIIGNINSIGRGHNLQRADRCLFAEFSWSDELNKQCEKRAARRGRNSKNYVRCEYVVAPETLDEVILNTVFTRARNVERIIG